MRRGKLTLCGIALAGAIALGGPATAADITVCQAQLADGSLLDLSIQALTIRGSATGIAKAKAGLQTKRLSALDKLNVLKCTDANQKLDDLIADVMASNKIMAGGDEVVAAATDAEQCILGLIAENGCP
jgi:hypothetical protein